MGSLNDASDEGYAGMSGVTSFNVVDGEFFLRRLPSPDEQEVKRTVQGIADSFTYVADDLGVGSLVEENDPVRVTEAVFQGEVAGVVDRSRSVYATDSSTHPFNRIVIEAGEGGYVSTRSENLSASGHYEMVAIAVEDVRPFLLKSLDYQHTAELVSDKPTNDAYIRHLSPEKESRVAAIVCPARITDNGGPEKILVHYNAVDLTGEVVAGTGLRPDQVNTHFSGYHATGNQGYLVVTKTVPSVSTTLTISGTAHTLSELLLKPYASPPSDNDDVLFDIIAPGGLISLPTKDFKRPLRDGVLASAPFGGISPSSHINIETCMVTRKTSKEGYGRPRAVASTLTPDDSTNADYHTLSIVSGGGNDQRQHTSSKVTPSAFSRSNLTSFDIIDNAVMDSENLLLVHPSKRSKHSALLDTVTSGTNPNDPGNVEVELSLIRGRVEEITPKTSADGHQTMTIRGRSKVMDIADRRAERDFDLAEGTPVKEIGDLGTPTVTMTLGGVGQGGADLKAEYKQNPNLPGWKDRILQTGNVSVRNDRSASTLYASTRALVELPLFPSMFFDVDRRLPSTTEKGDPLPSTNAFELTVDCTMTAMNRPHMAQYENRWAVDWGMAAHAIAVKVNKAGTGYLIRAQRLSEQTVATAATNISGSSTVTISIPSISGLEFLPAQGDFVTIGEGFLGASHPFGVQGEVTARTGSSITIGSIADPVTGSAVTSGPIFAGMPIVHGGFVRSRSTADLATNASEIADDINALFDDALTKTVDPNDSTRVYLEGKGPNMGGFEFDPDETVFPNNDRRLEQPIDCYPYALALKGKKADGNSLVFVQPQRIDFSDIANTNRSFTTAIEEVIRRINTAAHPQAKNSVGSSAFDPPADAASTDTGSHMGYVRAFMGSEVESRSGERGISIVIHSTVPGAAGRNFAVWLKNRTPYAYRPTQAIGYGGPLATNSRLYQANSFPAPLPLGPDGETFVPITTFTGAPHGAAQTRDDFTDPDDITFRAYDGIGGILEVDTVTPTAHTNTGAAATPALLDPAPSGSVPTAINHIAVETKALDLLVRGSYEVTATNKGIIEVDGKLAEFTGIAMNDASSNSGENCVFLTGVTPFDDLPSFYDLFHTTPNGGTKTALPGVKVRILSPTLDADGILFFGGGHTGVVFDMSDGSNKDYSDQYRHHYADAQGFSGFANVGDVSGASAVLDFTDLTNDDTINVDSFRGLHHKTVLDSNGEPEDYAALYVRTNQGIGGNTTVETFKDELYDSPIRSRNRSSSARTTIAGPTKPRDPDGAALNGSTTHHAIHDYTSSVVQRHPLNSFNGSGSWTIAGWFRTFSSGRFDGPVIHGISGSADIPWGLHLGSLDDGSNYHLQLAVTRASDPLNVQAGVFVGQTTTHGSLQYTPSTWCYVIAGYDNDNSRFFFYFGSESSFTVAGSPQSNTIVDLTNHMATASDANYGPTGNAPNNDPLGFRTVDTTPPLAAGTADHNDTDSSAGFSGGVRARGMTTINHGLIGPPYVNLDPTTTPPGAPITTNGGAAVADFGNGSTKSGYFNAFSASISGTRYYGGAGVGSSSAQYNGTGYSSEFAVFKRALTFAEAQELFAARDVW